VAHRATLIYFLIAEFATCNVMYQAGTPNPSQSLPMVPFSSLLHHLRALSIVPYAA